MRSVKRLFDDFVHDYGKVYESESEYSRRYEIFKENLVIIESRNAEERAKGGYAVHGITVFADFSREEFSSRLNAELPKRNSSQKKELPELIPTTATFSDWRGKGYITPVRNQIGCGSC